MTSYKVFPQFCVYSHTYTLRMLGDVDASGVEKFGPEMFCRRLRTKLKNTRLPLYGTSEAGIPRVLNVLLLGPTGAGKSSLIYTWWRALSGGVESKADFFARRAHASLLQRLSVGWSLEDEMDEQRGSKTQPSPLQTQARHGTTSFNAFEIHSNDVATGSVGIVLHDSKGQNFYTQQEVTLAEQLLEGKLLPGSNEEQRQYRYWFMLGQFGLFSTSNLATSPHVLVLVFDASLRAFKNMLLEAELGEANDWLACYKKILQRARKQEHEVFVVLTHADSCVSSMFDEDGEVEDATESEPMPRESEDDARQRLLVQMRSRLSTAFCALEPDVLPDANIFLLENYRLTRREQTPELDYTALECLDAVTSAAARYVANHYRPPSRCVVS